MYKINAIWESVDYSYESACSSVVEPEDLKGNIIDFKVYRNEAFKIYSSFKVNSPQVKSNFFDLTDDFVAGEVYQSEQKIRINKNDEHEKYEFDKLLFLRSPSILIDPYNAANIKREGEVLISHLSYDNDVVEKTDNQFHMNWLLNIDIDLFPSKNCHIYYFEDRVEFSLDFKNLRNEVGFVYHDHRECVYFKLEDTDVFVGKVPERCLKIDEKYKPGFIFFSKPVNDEYIKKVRDALGFMLGRPLISLGVDTFNENGDLQKKSYLSPYIISHDIFMSTSEAPSSFYDDESDSLKYDEMNRFICEIINQYDEKKLEHVFWMYWHSLFAPLHTQAGGYGAIIEFILSMIEIETTLIAKAVFKEFRKEAIHNFNIFCKENEITDSEILSIIESKINELNKLPIAKKTKKQLATLGVEMSTFETSLWQRRHDSAHGNFNSGDDHILIREVNAFRSFCNRIIMLVLSNSENYIDYYSYTYPVVSIMKSLDGNE